MAIHSSVLAWRIPGTGEPGGLPSMGSHRVRHDWSDLAAAAAADCSTTGFLILHYLPEFAQTHVHWDDDAIQLSHPVTPFSSCPQSFPASGSFPMSRIFISGGQSIGASALAVRCMGRCKICFLTSRPVFFPLLSVQEICKPFKKRNRILHKFVSPVKQII